MNAKGRISMKILLDKLSAMRVTLGDDERALLDQLIIGSQADVSAHMIPPGSNQAAQRTAIYYDPELKVYRIEG